MQSDNTTEPHAQSEDGEHAEGEGAGDDKGHGVQESGSGLPELAHAWLQRREVRVELLRRDCASGPGRGLVAAHAGCTTGSRTPPAPRTRAVVAHVDLCEEVARLFLAHLCHNDFPSSSVGPAAVRRLRTPSA